jgi:hypothetical protein
MEALGIDRLSEFGKHNSLTSFGPPAWGYATSR